ncbi:putative membrane protein [Candidatus Phytoplasma oryzae]|uniref:Putative membrane protein n=1 Tax=Candidatus Phytoplasma oryzae TaxID=203274 RepID=A0A139JQ45_9MOLU|nr:putative membrane protein [Candidatus Phytoplasma oryzae]
MEKEKNLSFFKTLTFFKILTFFITTIWCFFSFFCFYYSIKSFFDDIDKYTVNILFHFLILFIIIFSSPYIFKFFFKHCISKLKLKKLKSVYFRTVFFYILCGILYLIYLQINQK